MSAATPAPPSCCSLKIDSTTCHKRSWGNSSRRSTRRACYSVSSHLQLRRRRVQSAECRPIVHHNALRTWACACEHLSWSLCRHPTPSLHPESRTHRANDVAPAVYCPRDNGHLPHTMHMGSSAPSRVRATTSGESAPVAKMTSRPDLRSGFSGAPTPPAGGRHAKGRQRAADSERDGPRSAHSHHALR